MGRRAITFLLLLTAGLCCSTICAGSCPGNVEGTFRDAGTAEVLVGAADTASYMPLLRGRRVAVLANHTAMFSAEEHLVDMLCREEIDLVGIFSPEHGFRGSVEAGASVGNSVDERTGVPILSLYDGRTKRPSDAVMRSFDVLVVDMQDVGLRFYTYYISMIRMMDACADFGRSVVVLDRPNPNGSYVDGPILDMRYRSGVGWLPIPIVHGMTMGELARMAVGEGGANGSILAWCRAATIRARRATCCRSRPRPICLRSIRYISIRRCACSRARS